MGLRGVVARRAMFARSRPWRRPALLPGRVRAARRRDAAAAARRRHITERKEGAMPYGGPPKEDVGPTQGWSGGPPEAPGPRTRTDAGIQPQGGPATPPERLTADEAQR